MKIVAPVSRSLPAADRTKSTAFYRDVLGFEERDRELIPGPARLWFEDADKPETYFFETDDVRAAHAAAAGQGASPSNLVRVNWVKMEMFSLTDPDGHTLWFGQSYDHPHRERPGPMMQKALPCLPVGDVAAAVCYYVDVLGFQINYQQGDLGVMDRDNITVLLVPRGVDPAAGSMYVYVRDADALYTELKAKGAKVEGEPVSHPWGLRDFEVVDLDVNDIRFGQPFE